MELTATRGNAHAADVLPATDLGSNPVLEMAEMSLGTASGGLPKGLAKKDPALLRAMGGHNHRTASGLGGAKRGSPLSGAPREAASQQAAASHPLATVLDGWLGTWRLKLSKDNWSEAADALDTALRAVGFGPDPGDRAANIEAFPELGDVVRWICLRRSMTFGCSVRGAPWTLHRRESR